jgi:hypothetical protein
MIKLRITLLPKGFYLIFKPPFFNMKSSFQSKSSTQAAAATSHKNNSEGKSISSARTEHQQQIRLVELARGSDPVQMNENGKGGSSENQPKGKSAESSDGEVSEISMGEERPSPRAEYLEASPSPATPNGEQVEETTIPGKIESASSAISAENQIPQLAGRNLNEAISIHEELTEETPEQLISEAEKIGSLRKVGWKLAWFFMIWDCVSFLSGMVSVGTTVASRIHNQEWPFAQGGNSTESANMTHIDNSTLSNATSEDSVGALPNELNWTIFPWLPLIFVGAAIVFGILGLLENLLRRKDTTLAKSAFDLVKSSETGEFKEITDRNIEFQEQENGRRKKRAIASGVNVGLGGIGAVFLVAGAGEWALIPAALAGTISIAKFMNGFIWQGIKKYRSKDARSKDADLIINAASQEGPHRNDAILLLKGTKSYIEKNGKLDPVASKEALMDVLSRDLKSYEQQQASEEKPEGATNEGVTADGEAREGSESGSHPNPLGSGSSPV